MISSLWYTEVHFPEVLSFQEKLPEVNFPWLFSVYKFSKYRHPLEKIFVYVPGAQSSKGVPVEVITANRRYDLR